MKANMHTLLPRFFGLYKISVPGVGAQRLICMNNIFFTEFLIHERFDLKGSTNNREVHTEHLSEAEISAITLKDVNFKKKNYKIFVGTEQKKAIMAQLKSDCQFLKKNEYNGPQLIVRNT